MGGGYYERDVYEAAAPSSAAASYSATADAVMTVHREMDPALSPAQYCAGGGGAETALKCTHRDPIVVAIDVTGSMGNWSKILYDKLPMFYGQILMQGYLEDPAISFAAVGDAYTDRAPLQVTPFAQGTAIDGHLGKLFLEGQGGGQTRESYELAAYFFARHTHLRSPTGDTRKGFFFFTGDEGFYPFVAPQHVRQWLGEDEGTAPDGPVDARAVFKELRRKFHVFLLHKEYFDDDVDERNVKEWAEVVGEERILHVTDPKAIVDVMLGAIAVVSGARTLQGYAEDMRGRGQEAQRLTAVDRVLHSLTTAADS